MVARLSLSDGIVHLRPFVYGDAEPMYAAVNESMADLQPWLSWANGKFSTQDARQWVQSAIAQWDAGTYYGFVIIDPATDWFIGSCSLGHINQLYRFCNLGYWVRTSCRGQGIAPRAVRLTARFAFERLGLTRVEIVIGVGNTASQRVAEKAQAHYEGILRNRMVVGEKVFDAAMYSFVPEDFLEA